MPTRYKKFGTTTHVMHKHNCNSTVTNSAKIRNFEVRSDKFNEHKFLFREDIFAIIIIIMIIIIIIIIIIITIEQYVKFEV